MLLNHWTALSVSLCSLLVPPTRQDSGASSCNIRSNPEPEYVAAYQMHYRPGLGCYSNNSSPSHQFIHVINLKLPDVVNNNPSIRRSVSLKIEPKDFSKLDSADLADTQGVELHQRVLVFVLNSLEPVKWKVEISHKFPAHSKQLYLVPSHSTVRFTKRKSRVQRRGKRRNMPSAEHEQHFLQWVKRKFKAVTSYSEVDGDKLLFYVGQGEKASSECPLNDLKPSPYAMISTMSKQPVRGCRSVGMKNVRDRPVYVIELLNVSHTAHEAEQRVELDIGSANGLKMEHDFYLVLHSPPSVKWVVRSHRVQGWIDIVTDADADLRGIRMHTVALRREVMGPSGQELIRWAEYYLAPVTAYTVVESANSLQLLLPSPGATQNNIPSWDGPAIPVVTEPEEEYKGGKMAASNMRAHLKNIINTRCQGGVMEVSLPVILTQQLDLPVEQLSLLDGNCKATKNRTHVILRSPLDKCQTKKITIDDDDVYSNAIVIHASGLVGALLEEELGSGYFDLQATSGSGFADTEIADTTYVDDEDLTSRKVAIDVECKISHARNTDSEKSSVCNFDVYEDSMFLKQVTQFPVTASSIYVKTSSNNPGGHVLMKNCWATSRADPKHDAEQTVLVQKGCAQAGVTWVRHTVPGSKEQTTPEKLRITTELKLSSYVHCELSVCYNDSSSSAQCPPNPTDLCNSNLLPNMFLQLQEQPCGIHTVGPLEITREIHVRGVSGTTSSKPQPNSGSVMSASNQRPQPQSVIFEGLDSGTVVGIAFAAFAIGILLTGALWFIHTHIGEGPSKRGMSAVSMVGTSGDVTPNSSSPISA